MLRAFAGRRRSPLRVGLLLAPAATVACMLACGDASDNDAQDYKPDTPVVGTDASLLETGARADGAVTTDEDVTQAPDTAYYTDTGLHDGTVSLTSTMTTGASVDLYSSVSIPLTLTSQAGFAGTSSLVTFGLPGNGVVMVTFTPDAPMVTADTPGTCTMVITTLKGLSPGPLTFNVEALGSGSVDAGVEVPFTVTVNPSLTIPIPLGFANNGGASLGNFAVGYASSIPTLPLHVVFVNKDMADYFEVGAGSNGAAAGFPDGQQAIAPDGGTEPPFTAMYTDAGTARVIDRKGTFDFFAKGFGASAQIAESGGGTDGGALQLYKGSIIVQ